MIIFSYSFNCIRPKSIDSLQQAHFDLMTDDNNNKINEPTLLPTSHSPSQSIAHPFVFFFWNRIKKQMKMGPKWYLQGIFQIRSFKEIPWNEITADTSVASFFRSQRYSIQSENLYSMKQMVWRSTTVEWIKQTITKLRNAIGYWWCTDNAVLSSVHQAVPGSRFEVNNSVLE